MSSLRIVTSAFMLCVVLAFSGNATAEQPLGMSSQKPSSGRFVKVANGYMVPHKITIPGTQITFEMVPIPGGKFVIGSPPDELHRKDDEGPQREVHVEPFWIGKYEITWAEYKHFMVLYDVFKELEANRTRTVNDENKVDAITVPTPLYDTTFTFILGEEPREPAVTMSHYSARQYTKWLSLLTSQFYRLPSEVEWEYACRAGTTTAYSFGDDPGQLGDFAWYFENADDKYHEVGQKKPNPWGLFDMHGNVAELVLDGYEANAYQHLKTDGAAAQGNVRWAKETFPHCMRGGAWDFDPQELRSAARGQTEDWREVDPNFPKSPWWFTDSPALCVGFRIVRPLNPPDKKDRGRYWRAGLEEIELDIETRLSGGRGVLGLVDGKLGEITKEIID